MRAHETEAVDGYLRKNETEAHAKMILIAVMASAIVAPKSSGVVFELLASCRKRGHANPKVTIRHGRFD